MANRNQLSELPTSGRNRWPKPRSCRPSYRTSDDRSVIATSKQRRPFSFLVTALSLLALAAGFTNCTHPAEEGVYVGPVGAPVGTPYSPDWCAEAARRRGLGETDAQIQKDLSMTPAAVAQCFNLSAAPQQNPTPAPGGK